MNVKDELSYRIARAILSNLLASGLITPEEFEAADSFTIHKYRPQTVCRL